VILSLGLEFVVTDRPQVQRSSMRCPCDTNYRSLIAGEEVIMLAAHDNRDDGIVIDDAALQEHL